MLDGKTDIAGAQITIALQPDQGPVSTGTVQEQKEGLGGYLLRQLKTFLIFPVLAVFRGLKAAVLNAGIYAKRRLEECQDLMAAAILSGLAIKLSLTRSRL